MTYAEMLLACQRARMEEYDLASVRKWLEVAHREHGRQFVPLVPGNAYYVFTSFYKLGKWKRFINWFPNIGSLN